MQMPTRNGQDLGGNYRYGFQGQEKDNEIKGEGNSINYKYRMHDPRIGRFFAVDPLAPKYPHNSPYAFSENNVIHAVELEGLEKYVIVGEEAFSAARTGYIKYQTTKNDCEQEAYQQFAQTMNNIANLPGSWMEQRFSSGFMDDVYIIKKRTKFGDETNFLSDYPTMTLVYPPNYVEPKMRLYPQYNRTWLMENCPACFDSYWEGLNGARNFNKALDEVGYYLEQTRIPFISQAGKGMQYFSALYDSYLDFRFFEAEVAWKNVTIRLGGEGLEYLGGKALDKMDLPIRTKMLLEFGIHKNVDETKEELIDYNTKGYKKGASLEFKRDVLKLEHLNKEEK